MPYKDIEKYKEYQRQYREKNRESLNTQMRQHYSDNKEDYRECRKQYYDEHRDEILFQHKQYYEGNKEAILERNRAYHKVYYQENRSELLEKNRQHVKAHREKYTECQQDKRAVRSEWLRELKNGLACIQCGESDPSCLDFHHRDGVKKDGQISKMIMGASMEKVISEIEKCDVLCASCHRKHHARNKQPSGE